MAGVKVLVVDEEEGEYEPLKRSLLRHGYEMHTTTTMPGALALAGAHEYKAAFISLTLGAGVAVVEGLCAEIPALPVIVILSSGYRDAIPPRLFEVAVNAIGKPLALDPVRLMLDHALEVATLRAQLQQQRQIWRQAQALLVATETSSPGDPLPPESLEAVLVSKLRGLIPSLGRLGRGSLHKTVLSYVEKLVLSIVLRECRGNQVKAAEMLGLNRNTLRKKIRDLDLHIPRGGRRGGES